MSGSYACSHRKAVSQSFGHGDDVGRNALIDVDQPAPATAHSGLDLVHPQQGAVPVAYLPRSRQIAVGRYHNTVLAWIGSNTTAATVSSTTAASASASPYGTKITSLGSGSNGMRYFGL
jgi:hypothetical protein